jgi:hypothetical protein
VLDWTGGAVIVGVVRAILIGVALGQGYEGVSRKFLEDSKTGEMSHEVKRGFTAIGVFGHLAQMVVFGLVGYGLVKAAIDHNPHRAIGLDGALATLSHYSYGPFLLGVVAAGLIGFACTRSPTPATGRSNASTDRSALKRKPAGIKRQRLGG